MKMFEYMACGKAVVTNSFGPMKSVIKDGYNGFLVSPGDSNLFAECVMRLVENRDLRLLVGDRARKTVVENYTWLHRARSISEVCKLVVGKYRAS
jgi:hypothetical protein